MNRRSLSLLCLLASMAFMIPLPQDDPLKQAEQHFRDKNFAPALAAYREALPTLEAGPVRDRVLVQCGICLAKTGEWHEAFSGLVAAAREGTTADGRALALLELGVLEATAPTYYMKKDGKITWGQWVQGGEYFYVAQDNLRRAARDLEAAAELVAGLSKRSPELEVLHLRAHLEAASVLEQLAVQDLSGEPAKPAQLEDASGLFRRMLSHYDRAIAYAKLGDRPERVETATYLRIQALQRALASSSGLSVDERGTFVRRYPSDTGEFRQELPGDIEPRASFKAAALALEQSTYLDDVLYVEARFLNRYSLYVEALQRLDRLLAIQPASDLSETAKALRHEITAPVLSADAGGTRPEGREPKLNLTFRNLGEIAIRIWRAPEGKSLWNPDAWQKGDLDIDSTEAWIERTQLFDLEASPIAAITHRTRDDGRHHPREEKVTLPIQARGTYLVEVAAAGMVQRKIVLLSPHALLLTRDGEGTAIFATDALTGEPVADLEVLVRERRQERGVFGRRHVARTQRGFTDKNGLLRVKSLTESGPVWVSAIAKGLTSTVIAGETYVQVRGRNEPTTKCYLVSDRPVYRPKDSVQLGLIVREQEGASYRAKPGLTMPVEIRDPRGEKILEQKLTADEVGSITLQMTLGEEPSLGVYQVIVQVGDTRTQAGSFRVEEYRAPEFEVFVDAASGTPLLGDGVATKIRGLTMSGAPVSGGTVAWRVFREAYWQDFLWEEPWSELYGRAAAQYRPEDRGQGRELVTEGVAVLDERGEAVIEWSTSAYEKDSMFLVQADVTDQASRTITGQRQIPITRARFGVGLRPTRHFANVGQSLTVDLMAKTPGGSPVASSGEVIVYHDRRDALNNRNLEEAFRTKASTDATGNGRVALNFRQGGRYALAYVTKDEAGVVVRGEALLYVHGPLGEEGPAALGLNLRFDRRVAEPGSKVELLVTSDYRQGSALVVLSTGEEWIFADVVDLKSGSAVLTFDVPKDWAPNLFAIAWKLEPHGALHHFPLRRSLDALRRQARFALPEFNDPSFAVATAELFVPPTEQLLTVGVRMDQEAYEPGTIGRATIAVRDAAGAPVAARLFVGCIDAAVLAIAQDLAPDIRKAFFGWRRTLSGRYSSYGSGIPSTRFSFNTHFATNPKAPKFGRRRGVPADRCTPGMVSDVLAGRGFGEELAFEEALQLATKKQDIGLRGGGGPEGGFAGEALTGLVERSRADAPGSAPPEAPSDSTWTMNFDGAEAFELEEEALSASASNQVGSGGVKTLRKDFRQTALWRTDLSTDDKGELTVEIPLPESLSRWRTKVIAFTKETAVGTAEAFAVTRKDVMARLMAPRFLTEGDRIVVSTLVDNRTAATARGSIRLEALGGAVDLLSEAEQPASIDGMGQVRFDWTLVAKGTGPVQLRTILSTDQGTDAMQRDLPALRWGSMKTVAESGRLEAEGEQSFRFEIPAERDSNLGSLTLRVAPTLVADLFEALPYLIEYPYGCVEQTMSRFVPAALVAKALNDAGTTLEAVSAARVEAAARRKDPRPARSPVTSSEDLERLVAEGLKRIANLQNADGGFGWWRNQESSAAMTAYVLNGLLVARAAEIAIPERLIEGSAAWLASAMDRFERPEDAVLAASVVARAGRAKDAPLDRLFQARERLSFYGKALLARGLQAAGKSDEARLVLENLGDRVQVDEARGTVHWRPEGQLWWWWNSPIETNAQILEALLEVSPDHPWIPKLSRWLLVSRRGNAWTNTRDTALAIQALVRAADRAAEFDVDTEVRVACLGQEKVFRLRPESTFTADHRWIIPMAELPSGPLTVTVKSSGKGRPYVHGVLDVYSLEEKIAAAAVELGLRRDYYRVREEASEETVDGKVTKRMVDVFERIAEGSPVQAGELLEVRLEIDAPNDFEHVLIEDFKPAGFEAIQLLSGQQYDRGVSAYLELRDERTAFFVSWLQQGRHTLSYRVRAENPGRLRAKPARTEAMYAPDFQASTDSFLMQVERPVSR